MRLYTISMRVERRSRLIAGGACTVFVLAEDEREVARRSVEIGRMFRHRMSTDVQCSAHGMLEYVLIGRNFGESGNRGLRVNRNKNKFMRRLGDGFVAVWGAIGYRDLN